MWLSFYLWEYRVPLTKFFVVKNQSVTGATALKPQVCLGNTPIFAQATSNLPWQNLSPAMAVFLAQFVLTQKVTEAQTEKQNGKLLMPLIFLLAIQSKRAEGGKNTPGLKMYLFRRMRSAKAIRV